MFGPPSSGVRQPRQPHQPGTQGTCLNLVHCTNMLKESVSYIIQSEASDRNISGLCEHLAVVHYSAPACILSCCCAVQRAVNAKSTKHRSYSDSASVVCCHTKLHLIRRWERSQWTRSPEEVTVIHIGTRPSSQPVGGFLSALIGLILLLCHQLPYSSSHIPIRAPNVPFSPSDMGVTSAFTGFMLAQLNLSGADWIDGTKKSSDPSLIAHDQYERINADLYERKSPYCQQNHLIRSKLNTQGVLLFNELHVTCKDHFPAGQVEFNLI